MYTRMLVTMATVMGYLCAVNSAGDPAQGSDGCSPKNARLIASLWQRSFANLDRRSRVLVSMEMHRRLALASDTADALLFPGEDVRRRIRAARSLDQVLQDEELTLAHLDTLMLHDLAINCLDSKPILAEMMLHVARSRLSWIHADAKMFEDLGMVIASSMTSFIIETHDSLLVESCSMEYMNIARGMAEVAARETRYAVCNIEQGSTEENIQGRIFFSQRADGGPTTIMVDVRGFYYEDDDFLHGVHIDSDGDVRDGCRHTGDHFNPLGKRHGEPLFGERHMGDLGNIEEDDYGVCRGTTVDRQLSLSEPYSIIGRSFVIDKYEDEFFGGNGGSSIKLGCCRIKKLTSDLHVRNATPSVRAMCRVTGDTGSRDQNIEGVIKLSQSINGGALTITLDLDGFDSDDGVDWHGFHVHQRASLGRQCKDTGNHYNGASGFRRTNHSSPSDPNRHIGDLGNVFENLEGKMKYSFRDDLASLLGEDSIIGRSIVIHRGADTAALSDYIDQQEPSPARLACCVIEEEFT